MKLCLMILSVPWYMFNGLELGADPGFQVREGALKKNCAERREARKCLGYFV
jgi:hypothetical protein